MVLSVKALLKVHITDDYGVKALLSVPGENATLTFHLALSFQRGDDDLPHGPNL